MLGVVLAERAPAVPHLPYDKIDSAAVLADFAKRLGDLEKAVKLSVPGDRITSMIALTSDTALISAEKVAVVGETSFFAWLMDVNGRVIGVDPKFTQIRGDVVRTGKVVSMDGYSWLDLDATGATDFLHCATGSATGVSIKPNGNFTFGPASGKQLTWDGSDLALGGNSLLAGTAVSTVVTNASYGATALGNLGYKLNNSAADILQGVITVSNAGGFSAGTIAWDGAGNLTGGSGAAMTAKGFVAAQSGVAKFTVDLSGNVTFAGALNGAIGNLGAVTITSGGSVSTGKTSKTDTSHSGFWLDYSGDFIFGSAAQNLKLSGSSLTFSGVMSAASVNAGDLLILHGDTSGYPGKISFQTSGGSEYAYISTKYNGFDNNGPDIVGFCVYGDGTDAYNRHERYVVGIGLITANTNYGNPYVPIANGTICDNLNVEKLGGVALSGLVQLNQVNVQFSVDNGATWAPVRFKA